MKKYFFILLLIIIHLTGFSQMRKSISIREISVLAKRPIEETGLTKTIIDTLILMKSINSSLSDVLSEATPLFVKTEGRGAMATVSFRGTSPTHTDVLWNGISIKSPMLGQVDFSLIPIYLIDNITLLYGASSIQSTSGALGGNINLNNKPDWNNKLSSKFLQTTGSYNTYNDFLQFNIGNKHIQSKTRIFNNYSKNNFKFLNKNIATIDSVTGRYIYPLQRNKNAEYRQYGLLQELYTRKKNITFSLKYWYQKTDRSLPRLNTYEGDDYANINKQIDENNRIIAEIIHYGKKAKLSFRSGLISKHLDYYLKNYIKGQGYKNAIFSKSNSLSFYNKLSYKYNYSNKTYFNISYSLNHHDVDNVDTVKNTGYDTTRIEHLTFFSWHQKFGNRFATSLILRKNFADSKSIPLISFFGFDYLISKKQQLFLKGNIGRNYRYPTLNDMYWQPGGNPDLLPEKGISSDINLSNKIKTNNLSFENSIGVFYSDINNWIIWLPSERGYWQPYNIKTVVSKGMEFHTKINLTIKKFIVKISGNYAFTKSLNYGDKQKWGDDSYGKQLPYVPVHSENIFVSISRKGYSVSYIHNAYSERFTTTSNDISLRDWLYPYYMNNLFVDKNFKIKKTSIDIQFKIYNLFNEKYRSILGRPMPQRNFLFLMKLEFGN